MVEKMDVEVIITLSIDIQRIETEYRRDEIERRRLVSRSRVCI